jgi:hypothetical protein
VRKPCGLRGRFLLSWVRRHLHPARSRRLLFLDDDPERAEIFLKENPHAIWVTTVAECLSRLNESWEEVHLDHDLGGQTFVDSHAEDCGMEVIRWLCKEPHAHLKECHFVVHTHHAMAGLLMVLQMRGFGYLAELRPFGFDLARQLAHNEPPAPRAGPLDRLIRFFASGVMTQRPRLLSSVPRGEQTRGSLP